MKRPLPTDMDTSMSDATQAGGSTPLKVLVTGGTGYVGRFLVPDLEKRGYKVFSVSRSSSPISMDCSDGSSCAKVLAEVKPDVIVHMAANSSPANCEKDPDTARLTNVPRDFVKAAQEANPSMKFVFLSTDQVLDGKGHLVDENVETKPINVYGQSKLEMESVVRESFTNHAILRLSFVYGPQVEGAHATFLQFALDKFKAGSEFSVFIDQIRSAVFIDDVVEALSLSAEGKLTGLVNMGGPEALSRYDFCKAVGEHLKASTDIMKGENYCLSVPSPSDISMDTSKLVGFLGRHPRRLAEALVEMQARL